jgi:PPOX class probable F420-dependent enzyme
LADLSAAVRDVLQEPQLWHLATINPDGSPQVTPLWVDLRGDRILVNTALGRRKPRNLEREKRVALSWHDPAAPRRLVAIQGRVTESYTGDRAKSDIDALAQKYVGRDYTLGDGEERVSYLIEPVHVLDRTGEAGYGRR